VLKHAGSGRTARMPRRDEGITCVKLGAPPPWGLVDEA
jgi:hypothetical protein